MFRFKRNIFIISNFLLSVLIFTLIYLARYSWITFKEVEKRGLNVQTLIFFIVYSLIIVLVSASLKLYEINKISKITESFFTDILISFISMSFFGTYFYITKTDFARFVFFTGFISIPFILSAINKILFGMICRTGRPAEAVFFGSKINHNLAVELFNEYKKWFPVNIKIVFLNDSDAKLKMFLKDTGILIADTDQPLNPGQIALLNDFEIYGGKIYSLTDIFSYLDQSLPAEIINNNHYEKFSSYKLDSIYNILIKRIFDIFISFFLLILLLPLILIISILVKSTSKGKIFFKQERLTVKNRSFNMIKFRTMKTDIGKENNFTSDNDKRITFIGRILRPLRIDEIPQLINVLKGEMSIVGPRPERPEIITEIVKKYPLFIKRLLVKPGITGWAQVKYPYVNKIEKMNKKLSYDLYYINNISFIFDLKIILYTFETILFRRGGI